MVSASHGSDGGTFPRQDEEEPNDGEDVTSYLYRGGFSTSIVDSLFARHGHSDCCALTCCGILLYDRNTFLLTDKRPSWKSRCCGVVVFLALIIAGAVVAAVSASSNQEREEDDQGDGQEAPAPDSTKPSDTPPHIVPLLAGLIAGVMFYSLYRAAHHRFIARRFLMARMYQERLSIADAPEDGGRGADRRTINVNSATPLVAVPGHASVGTFLKLQEPAMLSATSICGCIPKDAILADPSTSARSNPSRKDARCGTDFCHFMWKALSSLCCGACCGCWCQCLGLCAMAQEDRELQRMLPQERFQMDYITFQPFDEYAPKLMALRENKVNNMLKHMEALSDLSKYLIRVLLLSLGGLTVFAFSGLDPFVQPIHLVVVMLVLFQAFIIVYFVHWQFNRFDLSLDAVIKYFASGFILCTANAFVYEMLVSTTLGVGSWIVRMVVASVIIVTRRADGLTEDSTDDSLAGSDDVAIGASENDAPVQLTAIWILVLVAFLNAFAVAALVEEISKYFGFWMVEHPDLLIPEDEEPNQKEEEEIALPPDQNTTQSSEPSEQRTLKSLGAGITVAMVTTAVGFACCENFMYVFVYARPSNPATEISTLLARSIFPVHPLAAAIQSIGVCRRDIEKDRAMGFGRIIFPALVLHGSFDFALMFLELLIRQSSGADGDNHDEPGAPVDDPAFQDDEGFGQQLPGLLSSVCIVLIGIIYYVTQAIAQRRRLVALDDSRQTSSEYEQLL